jgi:hypothetical protein
LALDNEDLGQEFYKMLISTSGIKLIDFQNFNNNSFHVVTELTCKNGVDKFFVEIDGASEADILNIKNRAKKIFRNIPHYTPKSEFKNLLNFSGYHQSNRDLP